MDNQSLIKVNLEVDHADLIIIKKALALYITQEIRSSSTYSGKLVGIASDLKAKVEDLESRVR